MGKHEPLWRTPSRNEACDILIFARAETNERISQLDDSQLALRTQVGGGEWSVKDLIGHLASVEESALAVALGKKPRHSGAESVDEINALEVARKARWSVRRVRDDAIRVRAELLTVIDTMGDERWKAKIQTGSGKSALGLVLGRLLVGGRFGLFAHDLEHLRDLDASVKSLNAATTTSSE